MLSNRAIRVSALALAAVGMVFLAGNRAEAEHDVRYRFGGARHGFAAEQHMIRSLDLMESAYDLRHRRMVSNVLIQQSLDQVRLARHDAVSHRTRTYLDFAADHLRSYLRNGRTGEIDHAARHINQALASEQLARRSVPRHGHAFHGGHRYHPVVVHPARPVVVQPARSGISLGGSWGRVNIRF